MLCNWVLVEARLATHPLQPGDALFWRLQLRQDDVHVLGPQNRLLNKPSNNTYNTIAADDDNYNDHIEKNDDNDSDDQ